MEILIATERVADQIISNKQELIALDKRRQVTREAIRDLQKSDAQHFWLTIGSMLVKTKKEKALELLKKGNPGPNFIPGPQLLTLFSNSDQIQIGTEINTITSDQKILVVKLRDLEHLPQLQGFDLQPLGGNEVNALRSNIPDFM